MWFWRKQTSRDWQCRRYVCVRVYKTKRGGGRNVDRQNNITACVISRSAYDWNNRNLTVVRRKLLKFQNPRTCQSGCTCAVGNFSEKLTVRLLGPVRMRISSDSGQVCWHNTARAETILMKVFPSTPSENRQFLLVRRAGTPTPVYCIVLLKTFTFVLGKKNSNDFFFFLTTVL